MIAKAKSLNKTNREILIAYLHLLHMQEYLHRASALQAHWVRAEHCAHWVGAYECVGMDRAVRLLRGAGMDT